jgi:hypothetical protein
MLKGTVVLALAVAAELPLTKAFAAPHGPGPDGL